MILSGHHGPHASRAAYALLSRSAGAATSEPAMVTKFRQKRLAPLLSSVLLLLGCDNGSFPAESPAPSFSPLGAYDYAEVLRKSILFYEAQRSGALPEDNRVPWRGDSALDDSGVYAPNGATMVVDDLTGGWYTAGNNMKFHFPLAASTTFLAWGMIEFEAGYDAAGQLAWGLDQLRWETDYLLRTSVHVEEDFLWAQVGDPKLDFEWWGRPEDMVAERPAFFVDADNPGSDLAGEIAAALTATSILFRRHGNGAYADRLLSRARECFGFARRHRALYHATIPGAKDWYQSHREHDELAWAAAWLYRATGDGAYLSFAEEEYEEAGCADADLQWLEFSWDDKCPGVGVLLFALTGVKPRYRDATERFLTYWLPPEKAPAKEHVTYTPSGLAWWSDWGSLAYASNTSLIALTYRKILLARYGDDTGDLPADLLDFATQQIHYILGDAGHSFVIGFGEDPPLRPHHPASSCPADEDPCMMHCPDNRNCPNAINPAPNPHVLVGALVGGPDDRDRWEDDRTNYVTNEVSVTYNAGFQGAVAGLLEAYAAPLETD